MRLATTIARLKTIAAFRQNVAGAVAYAKAIRGAVISTPSAWVIPVAVRSLPSPFSNQVVQQEIAPRLGVVIAAQNLRDGTGGTANEELQDLREAVMQKLLAWSPATDLGGMEYAGGQLLDFDDQVLFWQDDYTTLSTIRST